MCIRDRVCSNADFQTESLQDGSFSLAVEGNPTGFIKTEGGFDPNTNWEIPSNEGLAIGHPTVEQKLFNLPLEYNASCL